MRGRRGSTSLHDSESSGTIYDYAAGTFTVINHEDRTYFTTSFEDMAQPLEAQAAEARERIHEARAKAGNATDSVEQSDIDIDVEVSVDQPGDRQTIAGYEADWTSRDLPADRIIREMFEASPDWGEPR